MSTATRNDEGLLDVDVQLRPEGRSVALLAGRYPELQGIGGAIVATEDEAVARLAGIVDRGGMDVQP